MLRSLDETATGLGADGDRWRGVFGPLGRTVRRPRARGPRTRCCTCPAGRSCSAGSGCGPRCRPASWPGGSRTDAARALFAGCAAHICRPLERPATAAVGTMLIAAGHRHGWPVAEGGSRAITDALASLLRSLGGRIETGVAVRSLADLPAAR